MGFHDGPAGKESACNAGESGDAGSIPGLGKMPWRRKWQPTPAFLAGKSHGQRSLADYSPWGHKELDQLSDRFTSFFTFLCQEYNQDVRKANSG